MIEGKETIFVKHIENHIKNMTPEEKRHGEIMCKICGKTIDEIYDNYIKDEMNYESAKEDEFQHQQKYK